MTADPAAPSPLHPPLRSEDDAAELVRAVIGLDDIASGSLLLFVCDIERRPAVPVLITDVPVTAPPGPALDHWFEHLEGVLGSSASSLVFARARSGRSYVVDHDRGWHEAVVRGCARTGVPLLAAFLVTAHAVVPFPSPVGGLAR